MVRNEVIEIIKSSRREGKVPNLSQLDLSGINLSEVDLRGADLSGANVAGANLEGATFEFSRLTEANFTGANVRGAWFVGANSPRGLIEQQLYSTASYQEKNLQGIGLSRNDLTGWDFAGQNLSGADLFRSTFTSAQLSGANLAGANLESATLTNADLTGANLSSSTLTNADLSAADTRGASGLDSAGAITANTILPDGQIDGLELAARGAVRDDAGAVVVNNRHDVGPRFISRAVDEPLGVGLESLAVDRFAFEGELHDIVRRDAGRRARA